MRVVSRWQRSALVAVVALLAFARPASWAEDLPPQVRLARQMAEDLPLPAKALGFHFLGSGKRADGAEVELSIRAEPVQEAGLPAWKVTEIWGAKASGAGARRTVECVLAQDFTPIRGGTYEDGTSAPQKVEWLAGEKVLAIQVSGKNASGKAARIHRSGWYAGQPIVEVGGFVLWTRLTQRGAPPYQVDFGAPSWNRLTGEAHAFLGLQVVGGPGPDFMIQEPNAPEPTRVETFAWIATRQDGSKLLQVLVDTKTGWPRMVTVHGTTYAGDSRAL